ncbi:hypothetical protein [Pseudomonas sp.]|uniref:hypothetical protein n=1 Tax=Pseudomonas sp. TaxID=306 RepID=UPI0031D58392
MLLEDISSSSTPVEEQLKLVVRGQSTLSDIERLFGPSEECETRGEVRLLRWQFAYTELDLALGDPQVLTVAIDGNGRITDFALV